MPFTGTFKPFSLMLTGAPGWLCNSILAQLGGALPSLTRVRCLLQPGISDVSLNQWRRKHPSVTEISIGDLLDSASLRAACDAMRGGVILHAAAIFQPRRIRDYYAINRDGTLALASAAKQAGVKRFVFISSTAAQGASPSANQLLNETMPCKPLSHYGKSKHEAELGLLALNSPGVFDVVVVRPGQFYGTPVPPHHVDMFKRLKSGRAQLIGGREFRAAGAVWRTSPPVRSNAFYHPRAAGQIFNICDVQSYTQREIFEAAAAALNIRPRFRRTPGFTATLALWTGTVAARFDRYSAKRHSLSEQNRHTGASSQKAKEILGFEPVTNLHDGMALEVAWCRDLGLLD